MTHIKSTVTQIKRLLGRKYDADLQAELPLLGFYNVVPMNNNNKAGVEVCSQYIYIHIHTHTHVTHMRVHTRRERERKHTINKQLLRV
jgi:hypothetical protein